MHAAIPVARSMSDVDVAFNDEGQQYGNLDESSAIAKVSRRGLVVWCGDHKQTPGGLRKSDEARAFRRKLMRRPIALRGDTKFMPPHMLRAIVHPYVQDVPGPQVAGVRQLLHESTRQPLGLSAGSVAVLQELCQETWYYSVLLCSDCSVVASTSMPAPTLGKWWRSRASFWWPKKVLQYSTTATKW